MQIARYVPVKEEFVMFVVSAVISDTPPSHSQSASSRSETPIDSQVAPASASHVNNEEKSLTMMQ